MAFPETICVLGMHRSGTSCLTGSLQASGLNLGEHHTWNRYNLKGNRENQGFVDFHDNLLERNQGSWDKPPRKLKYNESDKQLAHSLAGELSENSPWGFKDPRALLALELWEEVLPNAQYIGIFRHPLAVIASLQNRDDRMSTEHCMDLWYQYNKSLYKAYKNKQFPLLCFDWEEGTFHSRYNEIVEQLGLKPLSKDEQFYTADLHTNQGSGSKSLSWKVSRLYKKLLTAASNF